MQSNKSVESPGPEHNPDNPAIERKVQHRLSFTGSLLNSPPPPLPPSEPTPALVLSDESEVKPTPAKLLDDESAIALSLQSCHHPSINHSFNDQHGTSSGARCNEGNDKDRTSRNSVNEDNHSPPTAVPIRVIGKDVVVNEGNNHAITKATVIGVMDRNSISGNGIVHVDGRDVIVSGIVNADKKGVSESNSIVHENDHVTTQQNGNSHDSNIDSIHSHIETLPEAVVIPNGKITVFAGANNSRTSSVGENKSDVIVDKLSNTKEDLHGSNLVEKEIEEEEDGDDHDESLILRHVDSYGNLIDADGSCAGEETTSPPATKNVSEEKVGDEIVEGGDHSTYRDTSMWNPSSSMGIAISPPAPNGIVIGATDPRNLPLPAQYELKIHIIRGNISGGGLKNVSHVEVRVNDELIHTTENIAAPPIWNETVHYFLHQLEFSTPVIISLSLFKKRWTSAGFKLVGTMQLPLIDLADSILDKYGIIEREYNLNINRRNLTLTGNLYLGFQLRSIHVKDGSSGSSSNGMDVTSPVRFSTITGSSSNAISATTPYTTNVTTTSANNTPARDKLTRRASFRKMDTTYSFKTPLLGSDQNESEGNETHKNKLNDQEKNGAKEELSEESSKVLGLIERIGQVVQLDIIFKVWEILFDIIGIFVTILKAMDPRVYYAMFVIFIFYLSYSEQHQYRDISASISKMEHMLKQLESKLS